MSKWHVITPDTEQQWNDYYDLRWRLLRGPWAQARGSERDELEQDSVHRMVQSGHRVIGVGRIHLQSDSNIAQLRYMAVDAEFQKQGIASAILRSLESAAAQDLKATSIELNSRESAVSFYNKQGYEMISPAHVLYGEIAHFLMRKAILKDNLALL